MRSRKIIGAIQDRNRKQMVLLVTIYIVVMKISSILIYQEKSRNLNDSWVRNIDDDTIFFAVIPNRWSNNSIEKQKKCLINT